MPRAGFKPMILVSATQDHARLRHCGHWEFKWAPSEYNPDTVLQNTVKISEFKMTGIPEANSEW